MRTKSRLFVPVVVGLAALLSSAIASAGYGPVQTGTTRMRASHKAAVTTGATNLGLSPRRVKVQYLSARGAISTWVVESRAKATTGTPLAEYLKVRTLADKVETRTPIGNTGYTRIQRLFGARGYQKQAAR